MPSFGRSLLSSLGGFSPVNRLTGKAKRPGDAPSSSPTHMQAPPPKRRRTDEHDEDVAVVQSVQVAADRGHHQQQQRLRKKPSEASIDILIQSSPDLSLYERPRSRSRSASVFSGSQLDGNGGSSSNNNNSNNLMNQDEMRLIERGSVATPNRRRRRKHKNSGFGMSEGGGIGRPVSLQSPSPEPEEPFVIEDDASPVKPTFASAKPNRNLSIDLSSSNSSAKGRFRDRMSNNNKNNNKNQGEIAPSQRKNGIYNNKTHSESVDELSEEYFPDPTAKRQQISRNPVIHLGEAPARVAGAAAEKRRQLQLLEKREHERELQKKEQKKKEQQQQSPKASATTSIMVETIIESPLQVKAAFRQPSTFFVADQDANVSSFSLTIKPPFIENLVPVDTARARSEKLHWLKMDLFHVRIISYNVDSPIVFITLPQGDGMGALMGLQFDSVEEVRRFASWATDSLLSQSFRLDQKSSPEQLKRKFDRCLAEVQDHKESKDQKDKDQKDSKDAKESTPAKVGSDKGSARSSPAVNTEHMSLRRTRSSRNLNSGATEMIDLDGHDTKSSNLIGSSPTTTSSDVVATGDRASRLRNRAARLPPSRPLLEDMEFERWTLKNPDWARDWRVPLTYSRTTVDKDDVARLDEGEFLNDNIINFYIQFLQDSLKLGNSPVSSRVYFHNTFFYEKLRPRKGQKIAFDGVKRWTAKVDLFGYDYIIIPVNEHAHWWLAIICNVPKILDKALPESMKEKMPEVVEELEAIKGLEASASNSPDKSSAAPVDVDAHADAHADDVQETGVYRFVPIDVDGPKPRPRSVVIDDEEDTSKQPSAPTSSTRPGGQRKDTPIDVDGSEAKTDDKHSQPIVLDSVEKDDSQVQAQGAVSKDSSPKPAENSPPASKSKSKSNSVEVSYSNNDDNGDDDEVTEIKSDLVASASSSSASASAAASAKKPFRGGGAALNSKKVFIPPGAKKDPKDPRIFTLDSLGSVHTASVDHLKQWMMAEIAERKGVKPEDPGRLGMTAKAIPQQENFCDCGVYLLLYIREFVKDPDGFIEDIVLRQERNWDTSAPDMRKQLRDLILHKQKEYQRGEDAKKKKKKQAAQAALSSAGAGAGAGSGAAKRPTPVASLAPATTTSSADVPIPSSETTDQKTTVQGDKSPTSSPISLEAGESSPFLQHGSKSPNEGSSLANHHRPINNATIFCGLPAYNTHHPLPVTPQNRPGGPLPSSDGSSSSSSNPGKFLTAGQRRSVSPPSPSERQRIKKAFRQSRLSARATSGPRIDPSLLTTSSISPGIGDTSTSSARIGLGDSSLDSIVIDSDDGSDTTEECEEEEESESDNDDCVIIGSNPCPKPASPSPSPPRRKQQQQRRQPISKQSAQKQLQVEQPVQRKAVRRQSPPPGRPVEQHQPAPRQQPLPAPPPMRQFQSRQSAPHQPQSNQHLPPTPHPKPRKLPQPVDTPRRPPTPYHQHQQQPQRQSQHQQQPQFHSQMVYPQQAQSHPQYPQQPTRQPAWVRARSQVQTQEHAQQQYQQQQQCHQQAVRRGQPWQRHPDNQVVSPAPSQPPAPMQIPANYPTSQAHSAAYVPVEPWNAFTASGVAGSVSLRGGGGGGDMRSWHYNMLAYGSDMPMAFPTPAAMAYSVSSMTASSHPSRISQTSPRSSLPPHPSLHPRPAHPVQVQSQPIYTSHSQAELQQTLGLSPETYRSAQYSPNNGHQQSSQHGYGNGYA